MARRPRGGGVLVALSHGGGVPQVKNGGRGGAGTKKLKGMPIPHPTLPKDEHGSCHVAVAVDAVAKHGNKNLTLQKNDLNQP